MLNAKIINIVHKVIQRFELLSGIEFYNLSEVEKRLYSHFRAVHYRMLYRIPILNQFSERIKSLYQSIFDIVKLSLGEIKTNYIYPIPDEEVAYLTMHFIVAIKDYGIKSDGKAIAAVVCQNGVGSSALVFQQLKDMFPEFQFVGPYDKQGVLMEGSKFAKLDMIFTTESNLDLFAISKNIFIVNPVMTDEERYNLLRKVYSRFGISNRVRFPRVTDLVSIIDKNSEVKNIEKLRSDLYSYLLSSSEVKEDGQSGLKELNLSDILPVHYIQTDVVIESYEDAIRTAARPLLDNSVIQETYLNQLIDDFYKGRLMQITDALTMPHANDSGGNNLGMGLVVLATPYTVKDDTNIKYILLLSAPKGAAHLHAMNQLLKLIEDEEFFRVLDHCSPKQIHDYIVSYQ